MLWNTIGWTLKFLHLRKFRVKNFFCPSNRSISCTNPPQIFVSRKSSRLWFSEYICIFLSTSFPNKRFAESNHNLWSTHSEIQVAREHLSISRVSAPLTMRYFSELFLSFFDRSGLSKQTIRPTHWDECLQSNKIAFSINKIQHRLISTPNPTLHSFVSSDNFATRKPMKGKPSNCLQTKENSP